MNFPDWLRSSSFMELTVDQGALGSIPPRQSGFETGCHFTLTIKTKGPTQEYLHLDTTPNLPLVARDLELTTMRIVCWKGFMVREDMRCVHCASPNGV